MSIAITKTTVRFGDEKICEKCGCYADLIEIDYQRGVEIYRCPCGELEYEQPVVDN